MRMKADCFKLIYYDLSITYIDVCFTPDSSGIALIPARFPSTLLILHLPVINEDIHLMTHHNGESHTRCYSPPYGSTKTPISYEPRIAGPLKIIGPAQGLFGKPVNMTHIAANPGVQHRDTFDYVTWNDDGLGEYCLWAIEKPTNQWFPRLLGNIYDESWLMVCSSIARVCVCVCVCVCGTASNDS
jgi:hypothetical protein